MLIYADYIAFESRLLSFMFAISPALCRDTIVSLAITMLRFRRYRSRFLSAAMMLRLD